MGPLGYDSGPKQIHRDEGGRSEQAHKDAFSCCCPSLQGFARQSVYSLMRSSNMWWALGGFPRHGSRMMCDVVCLSVQLDFEVCIFVVCVDARQMQEGIGRKMRNPNRCRSSA